MYNFDFLKHINNLLLVSLRTDTIRQFIYALLYPVERIFKGAFTPFMNLINKQLSYNCQYPSLQKLLNDSADNIYRRIRVLDNCYEIPIMIHPEADQIAVFTTLLSSPEQYYIYSGFIVKLPIAFKKDKDKIKKIEKLVNINKFAGTIYKIIYY